MNWLTQTKKPRLFLPLVLLFLSDVHFQGEAACEEVEGVRLTPVWWRRGESSDAAASLTPDGSAPDTVCQDLPCRSSLKTVHRTVFLTLRPSRVRLPILTKIQKDRHTAVFCIWWRRTTLRFQHIGQKRAEF